LTSLNKGVHLKREIVAHRAIKKMKHCIFGSGLIGSYIGSVMRLNGADVKFVARGPWHARLESTMVLTDYKHNRATCEPSNSPHAKEGERFDIVWLTVKCTALDSITEALRDVISPHTLIVCCQNGVGSHTIIQTHFPDNHIIRAMVPFNVVLIDENRLHKGSEGTLVIENSADSTMNNVLLQALSHALCDVSLTDDIEAVQWAKLQLNLGNGVNALANLPVKSMLAQRGYRRVIALLMEELLAVCDQSGITLPKVAKLHGKWLPRFLRLPNWLFKRAAKQMLEIDPEVKTSMWWDLNGRGDTEKNYLYGAVIEKARALGVVTPVNETILLLITEAESEKKASLSYASWSADDLLNRVNKRA
jgi:2-dehydropantoate 2-reductase